MRPLTKPLAVLLAGMSVLALSAACSGGQSVQQPTGTPDLLLADPVEALEASAERLRQNVQSVRVGFNFDMERSGFHISGRGDFTFEAPERLHLVVSYSGRGEIPSRFHEKNESELLVLGTAAYIKMPLTGWITGSPEEFGADWQAVQGLLSARAPLDYTAVIEGLGPQREPIGTVEMDGGAYHGYRADVDVSVLMGALVNSYGSQGRVMFGDRFSGPVSIEVWLDPVTLLPHKIASDGMFDFMGGSTVFEMEAKFAGYGEPQNLPDAPIDAVTFAEAANRLRGQ